MVCIKRETHHSAAFHSRPSPIITECGLHSTNPASTHVVGLQAAHQLRLSCGCLRLPAAPKRGSSRRVLRSLKKVPVCDLLSHSLVFLWTPAERLSPQVLGWLCSLAGPLAVHLSLLSTPESHLAYGSSVQGRLDCSHIHDGINSLNPVVSSFQTTAIFRHPYNHAFYTYVALIVLNNFHISQAFLDFLAY